MAIFEDPLHDNLITVCRMTLLDRYEPAARSRALLLVLVGAVLGLPGCFIIKGVDVSDDPDTTPLTSDMAPGPADMESTLDMASPVDADMTSPVDMAEEMDEGPSIICPMSDDDLCEVARTSAPSFCGTIAIEDPCTESLRSVDCGCNMPAEQCIDSACVACNPPLPRDVCEAASSCEEVTVIDDCGRNIMIDCDSICPPGSACSDGVCEEVTEDSCALRGTECGSIYDNQSQFLEHCGYCDEDANCSGNRCVTSLNACVGGMACGSAVQNCLCNDSKACLLSQCIEMGITPKSPMEQMHFGAAVAMHDDLLVVGAANENNTGGAPNTGSGAAYVFRRDQRTGKWSERQRLVASDVQQAALFGSDVATDGRFIAVGSRNFNGMNMGMPATNSGRVDIFEVQPDDSWAHVHVIEPPEVITERRFGRPLKFHDGNLYVGAPATGGGYVAVYARAQNGDWGLVQTVTSPIGNDAVRFGYALDVRGQTLLVGASARQNPAEQGGHVFAFRRSGAGAMWAHDGEVYRAFDDQGLDDVMIGDEFGSDVAIVRVEGGAFPIEAFVIAAPGRGRTYYIIPPQGMNAMSSKGIVTDTRQHTFLTTCGGRFVAGAGGHDGGRGIIDIHKLSVMMDGSIGVISEESISPLGTGNDNGGDRFGGAIACWGSGIATSAVYRAVDGRSAVGEVFYIDID